MKLEKIRVAVCDDQPSDLQKIKKAIQEFWTGNDMDISLFSDGNSLYRSHCANPYDLLFLDIVMPECDGLELARRLCVSNPKLKLIFVSGHERYVFDTCEHMPLWFIRKNILEQDMEKALLKYLKLTSQRTIWYRIKQGFGYRNVFIKEILYIECSGHKLTLRTVEGKDYQLYGSLQSIEKEFEKYDFIRVHKSYLVNQEHILAVEKLDVILKGELRVPLGKDRRKKVRDAMDFYNKRRHEYL